MSKVQCLKVSSVAWLLCAFSVQTVAQEDGVTREELEAQLAERDAIIISLQHAVNDLRERLNAIEGSRPVGAVDDSAQSLSNGDAAPTSPTEATQQTSQDDSTRLVVDEAAAERALERTLIQSGALLLRRGSIELVPSLTYSVNDIDFPVTVLVGNEPELGSINRERISSSLDLTARFGLPADSQLEIGVPYSTVTEKSMLSVAGLPNVEIDETGRGIGDFRIGFAKTLMRENGRRPDIVGRVTFSSGNGDETDDGVLLGGGFESWSGSLSFVKRRDPLAMFFSLGYADTRGTNNIDPGDQYSISLGTALAVSPESSIFGSITYQSIAETKIGNQAVEGSDFSATALTLGRTAILRRGTLLSVFTKIGISEDAPDYSLAFSLPMQW